LSVKRKTSPRRRAGGAGAQQRPRGEGRRAGLPSRRDPRRARPPPVGVRAREVGERATAPARGRAPSWNRPSPRICDDAAQGVMAADYLFEGACVAPRRRGAPEVYVPSQLSADPSGGELVDAPEALLGEESGAGPPLPVDWSARRRGSPLRLSRSVGRGERAWPDRDIRSRFARRGFSDLGASLHGSPLRFPPVAPIRRTTRLGDVNGPKTGEV